MMRLILPLMFFALSWPVRAAAPEEPFVITGGLSPDKKLAVVVYGNVNWDSPDSDEPPKLESSAYLYNETTKKNIGPLEEIDVSGDGFGHTRDNLKAAWSPDGRFLAINSRAGRRNYATTVYEIVQSKTGPAVRAVLQKIPEVDSGPRGKIIFAKVNWSSNGGDEMAQWLSPTEYSVVTYGADPKDLDAKPDTINDTGEIGVVYKFDGKAWKIERYEKVKDD